jgi:SusD family.
MKKLLIILCFPVFFLAGCTSDFEPEFYGTLTTGTFPSTAKEYKQYMLEAYVPYFANWGFTFGSTWEYSWASPEMGYLECFDLCSDEMPSFNDWGGHWAITSSGDFSSMAAQTAGNNHFEKVRFVTRDSKIIYDLENAKVLEDNVKTEYVAEAKMARGVNMYYLLNLYGPVPVVLDGSKVNDADAVAAMVRPTRAEFVAGIVSDLRYAADKLPEDAEDYGRFNKGAALTYLMRTYLNEKDFINAESVGREILALKKYSLVSDYASLFAEATEQNSETIWAVTCQNNGINDFNALSFYCIPSSCSINKNTSSWGSSNGGVYAISWKFYDTFEAGDKRLNTIIPSYTSKSGTTMDRTNLRGAVINKYTALGGNDNSLQGNDIVFCRYADVLLMLAEAINEISGPTTEAVGYVDQVRRRAGLSNLSSAKTAGKSEFREAIFMERGHELFFEGTRKMDLRRMGHWTSDYMSQYNKTIGSYYWPTPNYVMNNYPDFSSAYTE